MTRFIEDRVIIDMPPPFIYTREAVIDFIISLSKISGLKVLYYAIRNTNESHITDQNLKELFEDLVTKDTETISASCKLLGKPCIIGFDFTIQTVYVILQKKHKFQRNYILEKLNLNYGASRYNLYSFGKEEIV